MNDDSVGLLLLRVLIGALLAGHGLQKVSRQLGGRGLDGGAAEFAADGFRGGRLTALAAGVSQLGSGLFLALGALTPVAAIAATAIMTVALTVKTAHGLWVQNDGYEYPLVLIAAITTLSLTGPGTWSVDHLFGIDGPALWIGAAASLLGISSGLAVRILLHAKPSQLNLSKEQ